MDALDLFPAAGIRFIPVRHEQSAAHMADGFARVTGRPTICTGQNGPGITNMVTAVAAAWHAHSPMMIMTPSVMSSDRGKDGFQEADQLPIFRTITRYQVQVPRADRIAECFRTAFRVAIAEHGPVQVDVPRDYLYHEVDVDIPPDPANYRVAARGAGDEASLDRAADILAAAEQPGRPCRLGRHRLRRRRRGAACRESLGAPVATTYMHTDAYPSDDELAVGPIGYQGSKAAMRLIPKPTSSSPSAPV